MATGERTGTSFGSAVADIWKREVGELSSRNFTRRRAASEDLVLRLNILQQLDKHRGCVNAVSFNEAGDILISGSDDRRIILWDWEAGKIKLSFHSGHHNNVFQAKIMPYSEDRSIVTCAADGQVRHAMIRECGVFTKLLANHDGRVHKLAIEPGSPHIFYSCGEDGLVQHIDLRTERTNRLFTCVSLLGQTHYDTVHLNAITIDPRNPNLFAVGGSDQFARLFDIRKYNWDGSSDFGQPIDFFCPDHLADDDAVGITGLTFSDESELLVSYNDEFIYLFTKDGGLGPDPTFASQLSDGSDGNDMTPDDSSHLSLSISHNGVKTAPQSYRGHRNSVTVKGVNFFGPRCEYVISGSDCGRIFIWKKKGGDLVRVMKADKEVVNCIECHPHATVLASSGIEHDIKIWTPDAIDIAASDTNFQKDICPEFVGRRTAFFPFGVFYEDLSKTDDDDASNDADDSTDDDNDDDGDGDGDGDDGASESYEGDEHVSDGDIYYMENEVPDEEQMLEEEDALGYDGPDVLPLNILPGVFFSASGNIDTIYNDEIEENNDSENDADIVGVAASDDAFVDSCDIDEPSDSGYGTQL